MQAIKFDAKITTEHQLSIPHNVPVGDAEIIVMYKNKGEQPAGEGLFSWLESLDGMHYPRRSVEEIMAYVKEERASWDDKA